LDRKQRQPQLETAPCWGGMPYIVGPPVPPAMGANNLFLHIGCTRKVTSVISLFQAYLMLVGVRGMYLRRS